MTLFYYQVEMFVTCAILVSFTTKSPSKSQYQLQPIKILSGGLNGN